MRVVTGQLTASNYKSEHDVAVYETLPEWPFFTNKDVPDMVRPTKGFVLTKTHCTGY